MFANSTVLMLQKWQPLATGLQWESLLKPGSGCPGPGWPGCRRPRCGHFRCRPASASAVGRRRGSRYRNRTGSRGTASYHFLLRTERLYFITIYCTLPVGDIDQEDYTSPGQPGRQGDRDPVGRLLCSYRWTTIALAPEMGSRFRGCWRKASEIDFNFQSHLQQSGRRCNSGTDFINPLETGRRPILCDKNTVLPQLIQDDSRSHLGFSECQKWLL